MSTACGVADSCRVTAAQRPAKRCSGRRCRRVREKSKQVTMPRLGQGQTSTSSGTSERSRRRVAPAAARLPKGAGNGQHEGQRCVHLSRARRRLRFCYFLSWIIRQCNRNFLASRVTVYITLATVCWHDLRTWLWRRKGTGSRPGGIARMFRRRPRGRGREGAGRVFNPQLLAGQC